MFVRKSLITLSLLLAILFICGDQGETWANNDLSCVLGKTTASAEASIDSESNSFSIGYDTVCKLFGADFREQFNLNLLDAVPLSHTVLENRWYILTYSGQIYYFDGNTQEYMYLTTVSTPQSDTKYQGKAYSDLDEKSQQERDRVVFQIIGAIDTGELYGYCPTSGHIGTIDDEGIHWMNVHLDNHLQMTGDESWPTPLMFPYIESGTLYAYYDPLWYSDDESAICCGELWSFSMDNGAFTTIELTECYGLAPYKPHEMLLLRRKSSGRLYFSVYDPYEAAILQDDLIELPLCVAATNFASVASCVSGIAFHEGSDSIVYAGADGIYQSISESEFCQITLNQQLLWEELPFWGSAWIMKNGAYVFLNSDRYYVYDSNSMD